MFQTKDAIYTVEIPNTRIKIKFRLYFKFNEALKQLTKHYVDYNYFFGVMIIPGRINLRNLEVPLIFVHLNIIHSSIIGELKKNLLKIVSNPKNANLEKDMKSVIIQNPIFLPLSQLQFDVIECELTNDDGNLIEFENGQVTLSLIIRQIKT
jgi:UDP-N-acetylglucosamine:LPS N-acetylglucosamine transferase